MSRAERRALSQHLHRKHGGASLAHSDLDTLRSRLAYHEDLHRTNVCDHSHADYKEPAVFTDLVKDA